MPGEDLKGERYLFQSIAFQTDGINRDALWGFPG